MIVVELMGGLGNQLFQYAMARHLAKKLKVQLKLEISSFAHDEQREYELSRFNITANIVNKNDFILIKERKKLKYKIAKLFLGKRVLKVIKEPSDRPYTFDARVLNLSGDVFLSGYWQTEKYFKDIATIIRKEFSLKDELTEETKKIAELISASTNSVSLHFRRGDYLNPLAQVVVNTFTLDYYFDAIKSLEQKLGRLNLFIFSDEPEWTKENLKFDHSTTFVSHNSPQHAHEDMHLMSLCQHNIIANSSFSWWGAWLNNNPNKIVIAPKDWVAIDRDTKDIYAENWIKI